MAGAPAVPDANEPAWRERAVARSLNAARFRAEQRVQRFLDAAFELIDEKGTTEFTIQEVVDRSKQSLRSFYEYFDGKDELVLALFEETIREADDDIRARRGGGDRPARPAPGLRDPPARVVRSGRVTPQARLAQPPGDLRVLDAPRGQPRRAGACRARAADQDPATPSSTQPPTPERSASPTRAARPRSIQQTVMFSWFGNRLVENPKQRLTAEETWEFCLHGLGGCTVIRASASSSARRAASVAASGSASRERGAHVALLGAPAGAARHRRRRSGQRHARDHVRRRPTKSSAESAINEAAQKLGGIDALVYAPAIGPLARLVDTDGETWRRVFDTNVMGAALVTQRSGPPPHRVGRRRRVPLVGERVAHSPVARARRVRSEQGCARQAGRGVAGRASRHRGFTRVVVGDCAGGEGDAHDAVRQRLGPRARTRARAGVGRREGS